MRSSMHLVAGTSRADQTETSTSGSTEIILHQVYHECVCVGGGGGGGGGGVDCSGLCNWFLSLLSLASFLATILALCTCYST